MFVGDSIVLISLISAIAGATGYVMGARTTLRWYRRRLVEAGWHTHPYLDNRNRTPSPEYLALLRQNEGAESATPASDEQAE